MPEPYGPFIKLQEIEWMHRIEKVLKLPKNELVQALIRDRSLALQDLFPIGTDEEAPNEPHTSI